MSKLETKVLAEKNCFNKHTYTCTIVTSGARSKIYSCSGIAWVWTSLFLIQWSKNMLIVFSLNWCGAHISTIPCFHIIHANFRTERERESRLAYKLRNIDTPFNHTIPHSQITSTGCKNPNWISAAAAITTTITAYFGISSARTHSFTSLLWASRARSLVDKKVLE